MPILCSYALKMPYMPSLFPISSSLWTKYAFYALLCPLCLCCHATNALFKQYLRHYSLCMPRMPRVCHLCALYGVCVYSMLSMPIICPLLSPPGLVSCPHYASLPICASSMSSLTSVMPFTYTIYVIYALYALFMFCLITLYLC